MRVILVGCEYVGTTRLAHAIDDWLDANMGVRFSLIHDHWKIPHTSGHPDNTTPEEQVWLLAASPKFKEMHQRHSLYYHVQAGTFGHEDGMVIGGAIEDGVYGPMYFGYGGPGQPLDRETVQHQWERTILHFTKETVLVHVIADTEIIKQRMHDDPHENMVISEGDIDRVKSRFTELVQWSVLDKKIEVDNSADIEHTLGQFVNKMEPYLTAHDRIRMKARF